MKLYKSYCYSDINQVADSLRSNVFTDDGSFITSVIVTDQSLQISTLNNNKSYSYTFIPSDCYSLGYDNSFTGISTSDSVELGGFVLIAFVSAYVFKLVKRAL